MEKRNIMEQFQNQIETWVEQDKERIITLFSKLVQCETPSDPGDTRSAAGLIKGFHESKSSIMIAAALMKDLKELESIKVTLPPVLSEILTDDKLRSQYEERGGKGEAELSTGVTAASLPSGTARTEVAALLPMNM